MTQKVGIPFYIIFVIASGFGLVPIKDDCRSSLFSNVYETNYPPPLHSHRYSISPDGNWVVESIQFQRSHGNDWCDSVRLYLFKYCYPDEHIYLATIFARSSMGVELSFMADGFGGIGQGGSWAPNGDTVYFMLFGSTLNSADKGDSAEIFKLDVSSITNGITNSGALSPAPRLLKTSNFPNPFVASTSIEYTIPNDGYVAINICNSSGELLKVLGQEKEKRGMHRREWDGRNHQGLKMPAGIYYYQVISGDYLSSKIMMKLK
jgi:hypothetical protein